jgi:hypothetical protein
MNKFEFSVKNTVLLNFFSTSDRKIIFFCKPVLLEEAWRREDNINIDLNILRSRGSSVSIVADYRLDDLGSIRGRGKGCIVHPLGPDLL